MKYYISIVPLLYSLLFFNSGIIYAVEPSPEFALAGFKDSRERLRTGEFRVEGKLIDISNSQGRLEGPVTIYSAFDFDENKIRFDRTGPKWRPLAGQRDVAGANGWQVGSEGGKYVWMPERTISWWTGENGALIQGSNYVPQWAQPWDIRTVGVLTTVDLAKFTHFSELIGYFERRLHEGKGFMTEISPGIVRFDLREKHLRTLIDFDVNKGYVPVLYALSGVPQPGQPEPPLQIQSVVKWEKHNDVWVPKYWWVGDSGKPGEGDGYEFNFTWLKVNESIPPETFMTRGMEIPDGTIIAMPKENGKSLHLGKIGDLQPYPRLLEIEPQDESLEWWVWTLIGVAVLTVLVAIGLVARSYLRKPKPGAVS